MVHSRRHRLAQHHRVLSVLSTDRAQQVITHASEDRVREPLRRERNPASTPAPGSSSVRPRLWASLLIGCHRAPSAPPGIVPRSGFQAIASSRTLRSRTAGRARGHTAWCALWPQNRPLLAQRECLTANSLMPARPTDQRQRVAACAEPALRQQPQAHAPVRAPCRPGGVHRAVTRQRRVRGRTHGRELDHARDELGSALLLACRPYCTSRAKPCRRGLPCPLAACPVGPCTPGEPVAPLAPAAPLSPSTPALPSGPGRPSIPSSPTSPSLPSLPEAPATQVLLPRGTRP